MDVLRFVRADAERRLSGAFKRKDSDAVVSALREIVESSLPHPQMPHGRIDRGHRFIGGSPHAAWRWVTADGVVTLIAHTDDFASVVVSVYLTHPGLSTRSHLIYRDATTDPQQIERLVSAAVKQIRYRAGN